MNCRLIIFMLLYFFIVQCEMDSNFYKNFYSINTGLRNITLNYSKEIMLYNSINNDVLEVKYFYNSSNSVNDTLKQKYYLDQATNTSIKKFKYIDKIVNIYKYTWIDENIIDNDYEVFLIDNKKLLIVKDISWLRVYSFYKDEFEKEIIELILADTTCFFNCPLPMQPPVPLATPSISN